MTLGLPWFGPKKGFGWGWTPISWQGWALTALFFAVFLVIALLYQGKYRTLAAIGATVVYIFVVVLTGTKPGGSLIN